MLTTDFSTGMSVRSRDGVPLGQIKEIFAHTASHGTLPVSRHLVDDYGPVRGTRALLTSDDGFLQITDGAFLGFGGRELYVPLQAIESVDLERGVTLDHPASVVEPNFSAWPQLRDPAHATISMRSKVA